MKSLKALLGCVLILIMCIFVLSCSSPQQKLKETSAVITTSVFLPDIYPSESLNMNSDSYQAFLKHVQSCQPKMLYLIYSDSWH